MHPVEMVDDVDYVVGEVTEPSGQCCCVHNTSAGGEKEGPCLGSSGRKKHSEAFLFPPKKPSSLPPVSTSQ